MPFIQSGPLGTLGLVSDPPEHTLAAGAWSDCRNVRFQDAYISRIQEALLIVGSEPVPGHPPIWAEQWIDDVGPQVVYGSPTRLFKWNPSNEQWQDVSLGGSGGPGYNTTTYWQSFAWGQSVVFNNRFNPPQILYPGESTFVDLPNWGLISSDPANPTQDINTQARALCIRPYGNFMVAINVRDNNAGVDFPNQVWNSSPATRTDSSAPSDNPSWDYADPGSLSVIRNVASEDGPLVDQLNLGAVNVIYSQYSATLMQFTGSTNPVFTFNRTLDYGIANLHAVSQYNNYHFCVGLDTVFIHDGTNIQPLIDGRVQEAFYNAEPENFQVEHYLREKEIHVIGDIQSTYSGNPTIGEQVERSLFVFNYKDNNFTLWDAFTGAGESRAYIAALSYGTRSSDFTTWADLTTDGISWQTLENNGTTWLDFDAAPSGQDMFWMTPGGLYIVEQDPALNPDKNYFIERKYIDFSGLDPSVTADRYKQLDTIYPHINSDSTAGNGQTQITVSWSDTLQGVARNAQVVNYAPQTQIKADFRTTGRYLNLRMDVTGPGLWEMTSLDYQLQVTYGR